MKNLSLYLESDDTQKKTTMKKFLLVFVLLLWGFMLSASTSKVVVELNNGTSIEVIAVNTTYQGNLFNICHMTSSSTWGDWYIFSTTLDPKDYSEAKKCYDDLYNQIKSETRTYFYNGKVLNLELYPTNIKSIHN